MAVSDTNFKIYRSATWDDTASNGGAISATEIASSGDQVIFDDVTNAERLSGDTEYRKIFIKNCAPNDSASFKVFISNQYDATNQSISLAVASGSDIQSTADDYTFTQPTTEGTGLDLGTLAADASAGLWIRRTVTAEGDGKTADTFGITFTTY
jgi:hypothetical protein